MRIPLRLGPLKAEGFKIYCSGARWLCEPGQMCRADQVIAYINIAVQPPDPKRREKVPFSEELILQVAFAPRMGGRVFFDAAVDGGYLSVHTYKEWDAEMVLGHLEMDPATVETEGDPGQLRLLMLAGRRMTPLADVHSGLLPGWHNRTRSWWIEDGKKPVTLLGLGICDVTGVIIGEQCAYMEMFAAARASRQFVYVPDHPIAPASPVLLDQLERSRADFQAISDDLSSGFQKAAPTANDWMFGGAMLATMEHSPIRESYDLVSAAGLTKSGAADAVLLSLSAESSIILRHKRLGYRAHFLHHHLAGAGPAIRYWLGNSFERVKRSIDDIQADYTRLIDAVQKATGARVLVLNCMSTSGDENISAYAPFDAPMGNTLEKIAAKELNLAVHDVASGRNVSIIDLDAMAAEVGGREHIPDGIHQSRALQDLLRGEILHVLKDVEAERAEAFAVRSPQTQPA